MKHVSTIFLCLVAVLLAASTSHAQSPNADSSALLYEITGKGLKQPSYLFGTIHLICEKDMLGPERLKGCLAKTGQIILEFDMDDPAVIQKALELSLLKDGKSVKEYMSAEEYARLDAVYKDYLGMSFDALQRFKPMISSTFLMTSPKVLGCTPPMVYDDYLARAAAANKMPVLGLESAEAQIAAVDSEPFEKQIKELKEVGVNPQKGIDEFKALYILYLTQNSAALYTHADESTKKEGYSREKMFDSRNRNWIPQIERAVAEKPTFVAVGGGHLGGPSGVIALLRAKGYKLTPIKL